MPTIEELCKGIIVEEVAYDRERRLIDALKEIEELARFPQTVGLRTAERIHIIALNAIRGENK